MARKKIQTSLPPLPKRSEIGDRVMTDARLVEILRGLAVSNQRQHPQVFYPLRETARQLRAPVSAVLRAYLQLRDEGFLKSIRGSKTMLAGRTSGRQLSVEAFVGMPASFSCLMTLGDYRTFLMLLRRELQARGFVSNMVFFESEPGSLEKLRAELEKYRFDIVLWFLPHISARETILRLADRGIRVVGVSDGGLTGMRCRYEIRREKAIYEIASAWKLRGAIEHVRVARMRKRSAADEERIEHALAKAGLEYEFISPDGRAMPEYVTALCADGGSGVVLPGAAAATLALRAPQSFAKLVKNCRVAFFDGPTTMLYADVPNVPVDLTVVDWRAVAKRIVDDLVTRKAFNDARPTVFDAEAWMQAPLSEHAQSI